ncbi:hypothetical protein GQ54DRAFT_300324 [Martensiomyces pterosporus]|nr:hypothetical protein GQ54DRAFT_300324 [Martensiomyces pterosporus]
MSQQQPQETTALLHARWLEHQRRQKQQQQPRESRNFGTWFVVGIAGLATLAILALGYTALLEGIDTDPLPDSSGTRLNSSSVGRFLHITDMHVDPYYVAGSTTYSQCHRRPPSISASRSDWKKRDKDGHLHTGRFGIPEAKCDSPVALVNATSEYLKQEWAGRLDFVIWTGDSGRHDGDAEIPRTFEEIMQQNHITSDAMRHAFRDIPVVPNIGNNDISPHNELAAPGHKRARKTYRQLAKAWDGFIPEDQMATFLYGGYFARDVAEYSYDTEDSLTGSMGMKTPKRPPKSHRKRELRQPRGLTALSLNTIYWYRANAKVGGCAAEDSPGLAQLAWIRYQMRRARERNRDLILLGHVVPNRDNYRPTCYHGYARTVTQVIPAPPLSSNVKDDEGDLPVVQAQLFGHSNVDVWSFVGQEIEWITAQSPLASNYTHASDSAKDNRLWWEREVDEESGHFGELIRNVWSVTQAPVSRHQAVVSTLIEKERDWADMEDDPQVQFVQDSQGAIWPSTSTSTSTSTSSSQALALPGDFVDTLLEEFERVLVRPKVPRLGVTTISPSIIPKYFPGFRVFYYARAPSNGQWRDLPLGTLLDYDVYWANLDYLNKLPVLSDVSKFFQPLYRFSSVYRIADLSIDSYIKWARKLLSSKLLRNRFRSLTYMDS